MILKLKYPVFLIILSFLFNSCEKEYSLEGTTGGTPAIFTFTGATGPCANAVVTGNYTVGTALDATDIVTILVDVTTTGAYTIITNAVNGISFSGSGSFTATGAQTISLTGSGIPVAAGTFSFTPGVNGCSFTVIVSAGTTPAVFTYDGGTGTCTYTEPIGMFTTGNSVNGATISIDVNVTTIGSWSVSTPVVNGFSFSGTGNFTITGLQKLILTATGIPVAAGVSNFTPTNGCSFPITVLTGTSVTDFLTCTIDGVAKVFNTDLIGEKVSSDTFNISGNESTSPTAPIFGINLTKLGGIAPATYDRYLVTNAATFCLAAYSDGVTVTPWFTGALSTSTGFSVVVTSYTTNRIEGTFSGTIYSDPLLGTGPKVITNGSFSVPF